MPTLEERKAELSILIKPVLDKYGADRDMSVFIRLVQQIWEVDRSYSPLDVLEILYGEDFRSSMRFFEKSMMRDDGKIDDGEAQLMAEIFMVSSRGVKPSFRKFREVIDALNSLKRG